MKKRLLCLFAVSLCFADTENGFKVYEANCAGCHSVKMEGGMGRDFNLVSYDRRKEQIIRYISEPNSTFREFGYSSNAMPKIAIKPEDINDVADYIDSLQKFKKWMKKD
jgi:mono/diheme cytochrome c family protein